MSLLLEVEESEEQVIFGIPYYLSVSSSEESSIYYTLDSSDPNSESILADEKIFLPTNNSSFEIKIVAITDSLSSDIYSKTFTSSYGSVKNTRKGNEGGVVVMSSSSEAVETFAFNSSGTPAKETSVDSIDLDLVASKKGFDKMGILDPEKTSLDFVNFSKKESSEDILFSTQSVNNNLEFNPKAKVTTINARTKEDLNSQSVLLINRSYDSFDPASKFYIENESNFRQIISGNLVKSVYNSSTGVLVSYYYESKESRWIISEQKIDPKKLNIEFKIRNFVYKWVEDPVMSKIF